MRANYLWAGLGAALLAVAAVVAIAIAPGWALRALATQSAAALGREVTAQSVHLEFFPIALRYENVAMAGATADASPLLEAPSLHVPLGLGALLTHQADFDGATLAGARLLFEIDEMGHVNWPAPAARPGLLLVSGASLVFSDARTGQHFETDRLAARAERDGNGEFTVSGNTTAGGMFLKFDGYLKDAGRVADGGSPAELTVTSPLFNISFNGRLATSGGLSLAGTAAADGPDARQALAATGAVIPGTKGFKAFSISGALDAAGRAFALRNADLRLDDLGAKGSVSLDYRNDVPKLSGSLQTSAIRLAAYLPAADFESAEWSSAPLDLQALRGLDAKLHLETAGLSAGKLDLGGAVVDAALSGGRLDATIAAATLPDCKIVLDGSGAVQGLAFGLHSVDPVGFLGALGGVKFLAGAGKLSASLQATGQSIQEMVSTLAGDAQIEMNDGQIAGLDIARTLAAVSRDIQQGWPAAANDSTPFTSLTASLHVKDGIATMKPFKLDGPQVIMTASGDIDLLRRAIDLRADPRLFTGSGDATVGLPVAVVARGPWSAPKLYPDMANILSNPGAAYADLKGLGLPQLPSPGN